MKTILFLLLLTYVLEADHARDVKTFNAAVQDYKQGSYIKALDGFYPLAKKGDVKAQFNVAMMYDKGTGPKANKQKAIEWYEKAARQKHAKAAYNLGYLYHQAAATDSHAYEKARYWYEKAIEGKVKEAYTNLSALYMQGQGIQKDEKKGFEFLKIAAKMGESAAQVNIGKMYAWGEDIMHDKLKAYDNFNQALHAGRSEASGYLDKLCKESAWVCKD